MKVIDLKAFRQANGIQQADLANFLSVSTPFVSQVENGKRDLPENQLSKIMLNRIGWDTSMLIKEADEQPRTTYHTETTKMIPLLPSGAVAGYLAGGNESDFAGGPLVAVPDFTERGADCAIRVEGHSMYPRYMNGEILAIRILDNPTFFQWGRVYVLNTNQGCIIKRLFPDPADDNNIICHSENSEEFPDYKITKDDVLSVAIVVGHAGVE